jgi:rhomboid family GlyGly-CTERM serine protease
MGLNQGDVDHRQISKYPVWIVPGTILLVALLIALGGDAGRELFRYDRVAIGSGELWRLISGHAAHLGWSHFAMNAVGMLLIFYLVGDRFSPLAWLLVSVLAVLGIDLGFWLLEPQLIWYVGLSGLLHGYLAAGVAAGLPKLQTEDWLIAGFLIVKLGYEQIIGPIPGSTDTAGGNVVVAAHLYGAIAGLLVGLIISFRKASAPAI